MSKLTQGTEQVAPATEPPAVNPADLHPERLSAVPAVGPPLTAKPYLFRTPDGKVYVTIAGEGQDLWIDATVGKGGTQIQADCHAIVALAGLAIREGASPQTVALYLRGVTHERSVRFGNDALSVPDAIGLAIQRAFCD